MTIIFSICDGIGNVSGTPYQYVGVGYRLLDGNPEVEPDPGLLLNKRVLQVKYQLMNFLTKNSISMV